MKKLLQDNRGMALFMVIFVTAFFLVFVTGGLLFSRIELKKADNVGLAAQADSAADAGLQQALAAIPWVWNFSGQLTCQTPPCAIISNSPFLGGFTYTVTAANDPADSGGAHNDTNATVLLTSQSSGPNGSKETIQAYVRRSLGVFSMPAAFYINATSSSPVADSSNASANGYFDLNDHIIITGNDTNSNGTLGPNGPAWAMATTGSAVTNALTTEYTSVYSTGSTGVQLHDVYHGGTYLGKNLGPRVEPSIATVSDVLDVNTLASNFYNQAGTVIYPDGLITDSTSCPSSNPCQFGTSAAPQVTYIKETYDSDATLLRGYVTGYGVLVLEGRPILGGNFQFTGLIVHKRSSASYTISIEDNSLIYGAVLLGSYDEGDGLGPKARFGIKDLVQIYYSSQVFQAMDTRWASLLPKPPRVFAWVESQ